MAEKESPRKGLQTLMGECAFGNKTDKVKMSQSQPKKESEPRPLPPITDLKVTLATPDLLAEFRNYLKTLKKFEPLLDYLILCLQVFELPESDVDTKVRLMVEIYNQFLAPKSHNIALASQINRKALIAHCKDLEKKVTDKPDVSLLREGYNFLFQKIEQKHDLWRKVYKPTTTLAAILCSII